MGVVVFLAVFFIMACAQCTAAAGAAFESYENKRCNDDDMLTFYDDQCRERCEGSDSCAAYVVFNGSRCSLYQACTMAKATEGETVHVKVDVVVRRRQLLSTTGYVKHEDNKCSESNIGTYEDDDCESRCDDNSECGAFVIVSSSYCKLYESCTLISAKNGEAAYIEREESDNYDIYANKKCSESNIGTHEDDDCEERCDDNSECGAFVIVSSSYCKLYESCTLIDADNSEAAYIEKDTDSDNYDKYSDTKCSESNIGTYDDDDCEERCDDNSECGAFVIVSSSYCKLYESCTRISADNGEAAYIQRDESSNYDKYSDKKCSESNIGTHEDDDCEERCDDDSECGAFVIVSSSYCKLYKSCTLIDADNGEAAYIEKTGSDSDDSNDSDNYDKYSDTKCSESNIGTYDDDDCEERCDDNSECGAFVIVSSSYCKLYESCTRISADNGEAAYIQRDESSNYDKYSNKKCSESNIGTYEDDDCEDRCDDDSECGAFVIVSSSYCKLYKSCTLIDADNGEAAYIEKTGSDSDDSDNYDKYSDTKCSESNIGTYDDDDCEERCDDNSECGAFVIVSSSYCKLYESCTRISADNGEAAYIQRDESSNYDKYSNKKCSESNMGTYDDDDCEDRCDDESDCGAFVIVSSSYCKLYKSCTLIDADNGEAAYIEKTGSDSDDSNDSDNYDKYSDTKCSESNIGTYDDDDCEERCDDNSECGAFVIVSSSYCKLYESCTRISADNGEATYIQRDESSNYDKYSNKKCSESNIGTYDDDDCEDRCDDESECGAFVIVSSSYCKLYKSCTLIDADNGEAAYVEKDQSDSDNYDKYSDTKCSQSNIGAYDDDECADRCDRNSECGAFVIVSSSNCKLYESCTRISADNGEAAYIKKEESGNYYKYSDKKCSQSNIGTYDDDDCEDRCDDESDCGAFVIVSSSYCKLYESCTLIDADNGETAYVEK